jgi:hypothetical protein
MPMRGPMLFQSGLTSDEGKTSPEYGSDLARQHDTRGGEIRVRVQVRHLAASFDERHRHFVADAELERHVGFVLPVVFQVASKEFPRSAVVPPTCNVACCGMPRRKSAKSAPVVRETCTPLPL